MTNPLAGLERTVGKKMLHKIQTSNILCVGAGGIGCELLKNLALSGFRRVQVIDLDTIDVSNLNRQLLFRNQHVGSAKCTVACQVAAEMVPPLSVGNNQKDKDDNDLPAVQYVAHHENVCNTSKFNVPFVKQFDLVLNALDNVEARRRVNRLCLAANVPMIEAGTTGYLGQVTVIHKGSGVACYECRTQETQKVYPICTIRSTPSMPVHTIVWAKELYKLLFHSKVEESMLFEDPAGEDRSTYMEAVVRLRQSLDDASTPSDEFSKLTQRLLLDLYSTEIQKQLSMGRYKAAKNKPSCLDTSILEAGIKATSVGPSNDVWSLENCVGVLAGCVQEAAAMPKAQLLEEFDKDDDLSMRFVTAASNLRSAVFGIEPLQSLYSAKGIAGNIIPAIATTNAICAGVQILQAFKILKKQLELEARSKERDDLQLADTCLYVNCVRNRTRNGLFLTASKLEAPNPDCFVCKNAVVPLSLNVEEWTLQEFLHRIVKKRLGFEEPTLMLQGDLIWEEGDDAIDDYQVNLSKKLTALPCGGIRHGTILEIDDNSQNLSIQVSVTHQDVWEGVEVPDFPFSLGSIPIKNSENGNSAAVSTKKGESAGDDDDVVVLLVDDKVASKEARKRALKDKSERPSKKQKSADVDVIEIDD